MEEAKDKEWDMIVCPGGELGCRVLQKSNILKELLKKHHQEKKLIGAICAAPALVLNAAEIIPNKLTCYPTPSNMNLFSDKSLSFESDVIVDENIITSAGPATALHFALQLGASLFQNEEEAYELGRRLLEKDYVYEYEEKKQKELSIDTTNTINHNDNNDSLDENTKQEQAIKIKQDDDTSKETNTSTKRTRPKRGSNTTTIASTKSPTKTPVKKGTVAKKSKVTQKSTPTRKNTKTIKKEESFSFDNILNKRGPRDIFRLLIRPRLKNAGFRLEDGSRRNDCFYFPPGVTRRNGRKRQEYFDTTKGVVEFLEQHSNEGKYSKILEYFQKCCLEFDEYQQSTPKGDSSSTDTPTPTIQRRVLKKYPHLKI